MMADNGDEYKKTSINFHGLVNDKHFKAQFHK